MLLLEGFQISGQDARYILLNMCNQRPKWVLFGSTFVHWEVLSWYSLVRWIYWLRGRKPIHPIGIFVWLLQLGFDCFWLFCYWIQHVNEKTLILWDMINATWHFWRRCQTSIKSMQQLCFILRHSLFAILFVYSVCILNEVCTLWFLVVEFCNESLFISAFQIT